MKYNFDEIVERAGTYCGKWGLVGGKCANYKDPGQKLPFMVADMDLPCPEPVVQMMHQVADHRMYGYSSFTAEPKFCEAIIDWYRRRYGFEIQKDWILHAHGSIEGVNGVIRAFSNVGDGIIVCRPVYGHFTECIEEDTYRKVVSVHLINDGTGYYTMDWEGFEKACAEPTNRIFILCSPENPVGRVWTEEELKKIIAICKKHHVLLCSDEVHCDILAKGVKHHPILTMTEDYSNVIMVTAINKTFNLAGLSCANLIIPDANLRGIYYKEAGAYLASPFSIGALIAAYNEGEDWLAQANEYIEGNIDAAIDFIHRELPKVKIRKPEGTYIIWMDFSGYGLSSQEIHEKIYDKAGVILQDGLVHDPEEGGQFQRMCIPCPRCVMMEALERIAAQFKGL